MTNAKAYRRLTGSPRWIIISITGLVVTLGTLHYALYTLPSQNIGQLGLLRLGLLNLNEPAPSLDKLPVRTLPAVIVFCETCQLPNGINADLVKSDNATIARQYGLLGKNGSIGPGYAVVDSNGYVRYRTFDSELHRHSGEINRIVRGAQ